MQSVRIQSIRLLRGSFQRSRQTNSVVSRALSLKLPVYERPPETEEWGVFPRQREGRIYKVNWSLNDDNISPNGENAYHNARLPIILGRLGSKLTNVESVELKQPSLDGAAVTVLEAGDSISQEAFNELAASVQEQLSSGVDLFVEDNVVGSHQHLQLGVRVITDDAATALIARSLFFPSPPREVDHRARAKGWNFDPRWVIDNVEWNGKEFVEVKEAKAGQRPIVVFHGNTDKTAVQFIEFNGEIVGANVVLSKSAPASGLIKAVGFAASGILNEGSAISLPSTSFVKGKNSVVVVNADQDVIQAATASGAEVYGRGYNVITADSTSTLFRGSVGSKPTTFAQNKLYGIPAVVVGDKSTILQVPDNQTYPTTRIVVLDKSAAASSKLSAEDAVKVVLQHSESNKEIFVKSLLEKIEVHTINNAKDISKFLA